MSGRGQMWQDEILQILNDNHLPATAFQVLDVLRQSHGKIAPVTVYRALSRLTECGRVHRIESLNAFMACRCGSHQHTSILSICEDCGSVSEDVAPDLLEDLSNVIGKSGFIPMRHVVEVHGTCLSCRSSRGYQS